MDMGVRGCFCLREWKVLIKKKEVTAIGRSKKYNLKIELVDFNGMLKRVKKIKQRKNGLYKKMEKSGND